MTGRSARAGQTGFTLVEVLIALAILAFMMAIGWATTSRTATAKIDIEKIEQRNHELDVAMARMVQDLSSAYLSANQSRLVVDPSKQRTLFIGKSSGDIDELQFSTMAHRVLWADAHESEQTMIKYYAGQDPDDGSKTDLLRRETRRLRDSSGRPVPAEVDVLIRDVEKVQFFYFDWQNNDWKREWNSTGADAQKGRLPTRVKIVVTVKSRGGKDVVLTTQARLMLQEQLQFFTD